MSRSGRCRLCGITQPLTFEHVPPKAAFNTEAVLAASLGDNIGIGLERPKNYRIIQQGAGDYSLCAKCNNLTGGWYASHFVKWCAQGMEMLADSNGHPTIARLHYLIPLRIIKQIIVMFAAIQTETFPDEHSELVRFVMSRERRYLSGRYRIYVYFNTDGNPRRTPFVVSGKAVGLDLFGKLPIRISEISHPPFGYVLTDQSRPRNRSILDITHFANYGYSEFNVFALDLPAYETWLWYPEDYGTRDEIQQRPLGQTQGKE